LRKDLPQLVEMNFQRVWLWYSRESVQKALLEVAKNREVVSVFSDNSFGKRPDVLQYSADILQAVAEGAVSFHGSVERWSNPMQLDVNMSKQDLDNLRTGWDVLIDPDVKDFEIAKLVTKRIIEALKDHGVKSFSVKFSGGKGFHIIIPYEALPEKINFQPTSSLYPELLQKIIEYLKWYIREDLKSDLLAIESISGLSQRIGKPIKEITTKEGELDPFKVVSMDVFGSRHLFRLPYSLHEKNLLVSLPLKPERIEKFEREDAEPEKVKVEERFIKPAEKHDAEGLVIEALDWASKYMIEKKEEIPKPKVLKSAKPIPEAFFPPCIKKILNGLPDGRKRSIFILVNFLRSMNWDLDKIEKTVVEWNEKNSPPLRTNYLRTQLRWHFRQNRDLLPPNCDHENFYISIGVCEPDNLCKNPPIKNPVNYPYRKLKTKKRKIKNK
jgi:hypothetical protein